uniref:Peptidase aspartic putative domain-containing protein n=1 Tax=Photinus pyralis TaxID=7054 RepID=A0A1Y1K473_PHOPY
MVPGRKSYVGTLNIEISDLGDPAPVELLIGSDLVGKLFTVRRKELSSGLIASETLFGWTLMRKIPCEPENATAVSMLVNNSNLQQLWQSETLGITDPLEKKSSRYDG